MSLEAGALTILVFQMHCLATDVEASGIIVRSASAGGRFHASLFSENWRLFMAFSTSTKSYTELWMKNHECSGSY
jgi:hypothetical protein